MIQRVALLPKRENPPVSMDAYRIISGRYVYIDNQPMVRVKYVVNGKMQVLFSESMHRIDIEQKLRQRIN